jgi:hypothetical protein
LLYFETTGQPVTNSTNTKISQDILNKTEIKSFEFLRQELLVRLAAMTKEVLYLPEKLVETSYVQKVYSWYLKSFTEVVNFKDKNTVDQDLLKKYALYKANTLAFTEAISDSLSEIFFFLFGQFFKHIRRYRNKAFRGGTNCCNGMKIFHQKTNMAFFLSI